MKIPKFILVALAILVTAGCNPPTSLKKADSGNPTVTANLLALIDGVRVYELRLGDIRTIYVATSGNRAEASWIEPCGKGCQRLETVPTIATR